MPSTRVHVLRLKPLQRLLHGLSRDQYVQAVLLVGDYQARRRGSALERDAAAARAEIAALPERLARLGHTPRR
ncbi:MAG: hypothetical protein ACNA7W_03525 [Pseudomonadales bacterium]